MGAFAPPHLRRIGRATSQCLQGENGAATPLRPLARASTPDRDGRDPSTQREGTAAPSPPESAWEPKSRCVRRILGGADPIYRYRRQRIETGTGPSPRTPKSTIVLGPTHFKENAAVKNHHIIPSLLSAALGLLALVPAVAAQSVGDRVRVTLSAGPSLVGEVTRVDGMAISINMGEQAGSRQIPSSDIESIERSAGTRNRAKLGAGIGFVAGALAAVATGDLSGSVAGTTVVQADEEGSTARGVLTVVVAGLAGAGLGALIKTDRWEEIPLGDQVSLRPVLNAGFGRHAEPPTLLLGTQIRF